MNVNMLLWILVIKLLIGGVVKFFAGLFAVEKIQHTHYDKADAFAGLILIVLGIIAILT